MSQSLERALQLVDLVAEGHSTLEELSAELGVHKSTALRLLRVLESYRYVSHDRNHRYRIGPAVHALAHFEVDVEDVRTAARPAMRALGRRTGHTVHLATYRDGEVTYVDKVEARDGLRMYSRIGLPAALHATAVAKVLLGGLEPRERDELLAGLELQAFTDRTITDADALRREIRTSAERGWAVDHEEHETFMNCIGAPVRGADGRIVAAISVSVPNVVATYREVLGFLPDLHETVTAVSAELGHRDEMHFALPTPEEGDPA